MMKHLELASKLEEFFKRAGKTDSIGIVTVENYREAKMLEEVARSLNPGRSIFATMPVQRGSSVELDGVPSGQKGPVILIVGRASEKHVRAHPVWGKNVVGTLNL